MSWIKRNPHGNTETAVGGIPSVYDPLGNYVYFREVPLEWFAPPVPPDSVGIPMGPGFGGFANSYTCYLDGAVMDCNGVMRFINNGSAAQCPNNNCGPQIVHDSAGNPHLAPLGTNPNTGSLGYYYWDPNYHRQQPDDDDIIRVNNQGGYVWKDAESAVSAFLGFGFGFGPQNPAPSPTTQQTPIYCRPDVIKAMNDAWSRSGNAGMGHPGSQPVEAGFNLNGTPTNYKVAGSFTNEVGKMTIKYDTLYSSTPTFANFHIHPKGFDGNNGFPSTPGSNFEGNGRGDTGAFDDIYNKTQNGQHQAIQVYVMSWNGLAMYDPATGKSTQLVKGTGFLKGSECPH